jgi:hypothetical protein
VTFSGRGPPLDTRTASWLRRRDSAEGVARTRSEIRIVVRNAVNCMLVGSGGS